MDRNALPMKADIAIKTIGSSTSKVLRDQIATHTVANDTSPTAINSEAPSCPWKSPTSSARSPSKAAPIPTSSAGEDGMVVRQS